MNKCPICGANFPLIPNQTKILEYKYKNHILYYPVEGDLCIFCKELIVYNDSVNETDKIIQLFKQNIDKF